MAKCAFPRSQFYSLRRYVMVICHRAINHGFSSSVTSMPAVASTSERGKTLAVLYLFLLFDPLENDGLNIGDVGALFFGWTRVSLRAKSMIWLKFLRVSLTEGAPFGPPTSTFPRVDLCIITGCSINSHTLVGFHSLPNCV